MSAHRTAMTAIDVSPAAYIATVADIARLISLLRARGRRVIGPTVRGGAIVLDEIDSIDALPRGFTDVQTGGNYRLERRPDDALFAYAVGAHSYKREFFVPTLTLLRARRVDGSFVVLPPPSDTAPPLALFAARSCDLEAIAIQDRVFASHPQAAEDYRSRRADVLVVAVQCTVAAETCFCASMKTGPHARAGFDLALTERVGDGQHDFVVSAATARGADLVQSLGLMPATEADVGDATRRVDAAAASQQRSVNDAAVRAALPDRLEHPRWDEVASRCIACGNCTMVCPTCFCSEIIDTTDVSGTEASRTRLWESCFSLDHSYIHGGSVRPSVRSRYRQWLTHKFAWWHDQFETSGCVGCGRCITWCPPGIDVTAELSALVSAPVHSGEKG